MSSVPVVSRACRRCALFLPVAQHGVHTPFELGGKRQRNKSVPVAHASPDIRTDGHLRIIQAASVLRHVRGRSPRQGVLHGASSHSCEALHLLSVSAPSSHHSSAHCSLVSMSHTLHCMLTQVLHVSLSLLSLFASILFVSIFSPLRVWHAL